MMVKLQSLLLVAAIVSGKAVIAAVNGPEISFDGLVKVDNSVLDLVWVRPGISLDPYSKLILADAGIQYRPVRAVGKIRPQDIGTVVFGLSEAQKARVKSVVNEAFSQHITAIRSFEVVQEPGPDTLVLVGGLMDVVSYVPPERSIKGSVLLAQVGEANLVIELRDSQSGSVLIRAVDRRAAARPGGYEMHSNRVSSWVEVRRLADSWARLLVKRINELKSLDLSVVAPAQG